MSIRSLMDTMLETMARYRMSRPGERILVAVSGGPDSTALLHALWQSRKALGVELSVYHLNHSLRGKEADADAAYVNRLAEQLGLSCITEKEEVGELAQKSRRSLQEAAREVRYDRLTRVAKEIGASRIAVAHTSDDQAETVLMRLLRGSGTTGLGGIPPVRGPIIRPLLEVWRAEVEAYCALHQLTPREDASNKKPIYLRNRIRHRLIPLLEKEYNPEIKAVLARMAVLLRDDETYLDEVTADAYEAALISDEEDGRVILSATVLLEEPLPLRRRVIRRAVERVRGDARKLGFWHVEESLELAATGRTGSELHLPNSVKVRKEYGNLIVERWEQEHAEGQSGLAQDPQDATQDGERTGLGVHGTSTGHGAEAGHNGASTELLEPGEPDWPDDLGAALPELTPEKGGRQGKGGGTGKGGRSGRAANIEGAPAEEAGEPEVAPHEGKNPNGPNEPSGENQVSPLVEIELGESTDRVADRAQALVGVLEPAPQEPAAQDAAVRRTGGPAGEARQGSVVPFARSEWGIFDEVALCIPGMTYVWDGGGSLTTELISVSDAARAAGKSAVPASASNFEAYIDFGLVVPPLVARRRRRGDRMRPLGLGGTRRLKEMFTDAKIPREQRDVIPVISDARGILWVACLRLDERGAVSPNTRKIVKIRWNRPGNTV